MFVIGLCAQLVWHGLRPAPVAAATDLPPAPSHRHARVLAFGDEALLAKVLVLWLQAFDNQSGISVPFNQLDYRRVANWLGLALDLDPRAQYPLLSASRVYGNVTDLERRRIMLDFVHARFKQDPNNRWRWLAHASIVARHQIKDLDLALRYARDITALATGPNVPAWARDMSVVLLQDMGELEAAQILVGALLSSGRVKDEHEVRFLVQKLEELEQSIAPD